MTAPASRPSRPWGAVGAGAAAMAACAVCCAGPTLAVLGGISVRPRTFTISSTA